MSLFTTQAAEDHPIRCQRLICGLNIIAKLARGHHVTLFFSIVKTPSRQEFQKEHGLPFERYDVTSDKEHLHGVYFAASWKILKPRNCYQMEWFGLTWLKTAKWRSGSIFSGKRCCISSILRSRQVVWIGCDMKFLGNFERKIKFLRGARRIFLWSSGELSKKIVYERKKFLGIACQLIGGINWLATLIRPVLLSKLAIDMKQQPRVNTTWQPTELHRQKSEYYRKSIAIARKFAYIQSEAGREKPD